MRQAVLRAQLRHTPVNDIGFTHDTISQPFLKKIRPKLTRTSLKNPNAYATPLKLVKLGCTMTFRNLMEYADVVEGLVNDAARKPETIYAKRLRPRPTLHAEGH